MGTGAGPGWDRGLFLARGPPEGGVSAGVGVESPLAPKAQGQGSRSRAPQYTPDRAPARPARTSTDTHGPHSSHPDTSPETSASPSTALSLSPPIASPAPSPPVRPLPFSAPVQALSTPSLIYPPPHVSRWASLPAAGPSLRPNTRAPSWRAEGSSALHCLPDPLSSVTLLLDPSLPPEQCGLLV